MLQGIEFKEAQQAGLLQATYNKLEIASADGVIDKMIDPLTTPRAPYLLIDLVPTSTPPLWLATLQPTTYSVSHPCSVIGWSRIMKGSLESIANWPQPSS